MVERLPVIVEWMSDGGSEVDKEDCHYSVVIDTFSDRIILADPSDGTKRTMSRADFERKWLGFNRDGSMFSHFMLTVYPNKGV